MSYWLFCGSPWQDQLGYDQARQQHQAELKALGFPPRFQPLGNNVEIANDLIFRLDSLASWIEAHESWIVWTALNSRRAAWDRNDPIARRQGLDAGIIAKMPTITTGISDWGIARLIESFAIWHPSQWTKGT